jgi:hypothetical protein
MLYTEVASGFVAHAAEVVSTVAVFDAMVRIWPAPVPLTMRTCEFVHWLTVHVFAEFVSVDAPPAVAVPVAKDL